jgi:RNA polymerase sigma factor (sigma-70 family)
MNINNILENEELKKLLDKSIEKTYYNYKLSFIIEHDDFIQEVYMFIIPKLKNFESEKSSLKTYIPMLVMTCAKNCIQKANGQSKNHNKIDFRNNTISLEYEFKNEESNNAEYKELIGEVENIFPRLIVNEIINMSNLTKAQKEIIHLMSKGYSIADIAEQLNKSVSCIGITFHRAKQKIVRKYAL